MKIGLLGAGGPAGVNVARALFIAGHQVVGFDANRWHLPWAQPWCERVIHADTFDELLPRLAAPDDLDLVISQPEQGLVWLGSHPEVPSSIPSREVIRDTQAKNTAGLIWNAEGLRNQSPHRIFDPYPDSLHLAKDALGLPFWLRAGSGAGAKGATLVEDLRTAFHWIRYWETRGVKNEWIAEEYLPGRDFCWSSVWHEGKLLVSFSRERLEWIYPHLAPSGRTGTPSVCVIVHDDRVHEMAVAAVETIDCRPHGLYCVDLREDKDGAPRPTEINAGRFATTTPLYCDLGPNLADVYVNAAKGVPVVLGRDVYPEGLALLRHIDCGHVFVPLSDL